MDITAPFQGQLFVHCHYTFVDPSLPIILIEDCGHDSPVSRDTNSISTTLVCASFLHVCTSGLIVCVPLSRMNVDLSRFCAVEIYAQATMKIKLKKFLSTDTI